MKLSTNFLKDYLDIDINSEEDIYKLAEDMTKVGNEYDTQGKLINATKLIIGEVKECEMHPDSNHLHVCKVDIGNETLQIVCGAPNVRKGLKVIVALPGAKLPGGEIKRSTIRGVESSGMLCSIAELGLESKFLKEEDKAGIHELPNDAKVGEDPIKYMKMDDGVIDFDLTANRGDLISILGIYTTITSIGNSSSIVLPILLTLLLPLILAVVYGFAFYPLYKKDVNNKLKKYKNEAQTPAQLLDNAKQKGGTSIPFVLLGILLSGIISSIALTTVMASALAGFMENVLGGFKTPQNQLNTNTSVNENDIYAPTYDTFNFYNDYYFEYDSSTWAETEDGSLAYGNYTLSYIQSIENLTSAGFDINQNDGRSSFFTYLYNLFSSQIDAQSTTLELGSSSFIYDNGIYYSYFDLVYSASIERCYFVLIPEDDIFMEFILSNTDTVIPDDIHNEIVSYIGSITDEDVITDTNAVQNSNIVNEAGNENTIPASGTLDTAPNSEASNEIDVNNIEPQSSSSNVVEVGNTTPSSNGGLTITTPTNVPGIVTAHNTIQ